MIRRPPRSTQSRSSAASDVYKRQQVEVRRTSYGVPHILAGNVEAAGYGMGYVQMEDYGPRVVHGLIRARGELGLHFGRDSIASDFEHRRTYACLLYTSPSPRDG